MSFTRHDPYFCEPYCCEPWRFISSTNSHVFYQTRAILLLGTLLYCSEAYCYIVVGQVDILLWGILLYYCEAYSYIVVALFFGKRSWVSKSRPPLYVQTHICLPLYVQTHICLHACVFERYRNMSLFPIDIDLFSETVPHQLMEHT